MLRITLGLRAETKIMKLKLLTHSYFWRELKYKIRDYFFPRNKWLFKKIGNGYSDICGIIDVCLFECLVYFVEQEQGLKSIWDDELYKDDLEKGYISDDYKRERSKVRDELWAAYYYIKYERPELEKKHDESHPKPLRPHTEWFVPCLDGSGNSCMLSCEERYGMSFDEAYGPMAQIDRQIQDADKHTMFTIVSNRKYLWT